MKVIQENATKVAGGNYSAWLRYAGMNFVPTKKELTQSTIVVFLFTIILMTILSAYDMAMSFLFNNWILPPVT